MTSGTLSYVIIVLQLLQQELTRSHSHSHSFTDLTSEAFLGALLPERSAELDGHEMMVQTKIRPYTNIEGFHKTFDASLSALRREKVELLSLHGVNTSAQAEYVFFSGKRYFEQTLGRAKREGKANCVSFSTHLPCLKIIEVIEAFQDELDYVNVGWERSESCTSNQQQVTREIELTEKVLERARRYPPLHT